MKTKLLLFFICILQSTTILGDEPSWEIKNYNHEYTFSIQNLRTNGEYVTHLIFPIQPTNPIFKTTFVNWGYADKLLDSFSLDTIRNPNSHYFFDYCITKGNKILAVADSGYIYESIDLGKNWSAKKIISNSEAITQIAFRDENYGMVVNEINELFFSTDGGTVWNRSNTQITDLDGSFFINDLIFVQDTLIILFYDLTTHKKYSIFSFDSGLTLEELNPIEFDCNGLNGFFFQGSKFWGSLNWPTGQGDVQRDVVIFSSDYGKNWVKQLDSVNESGLARLTGIGNIAFFDDLLYGLAVGGQNIYYTNNGGAKWILLEGDANGTDTSLYPAYDIIKLNGDLVVSGEDKIYIFRKTTSVKDGTDKPKEYELKYLPQSQRLEINSVDKPIESVAIYDLTGKIIFSSKFNSGTFAEVDLSGINVNNVLMIQISVGGATYFDKILKER